MGLGDGGLLPVSVGIWSLMSLAFLRGKVVVDDDITISHPRRGYSSVDWSVGRSGAHLGTWKRQAHHHLRILNSAFCDLHPPLQK